MKFLIGLLVISQLFAGAKDCSGRRDDCETTATGFSETPANLITTSKVNID